MDLNVKVIVFLITLVIILSSCNNSEPVTVEIEYLTEYVYADDGTELMSIVIEYPVVSGEEKLNREFKDAAMNEYETILDTYCYEVRYLYNNGLFNAKYEFITTCQSEIYRGIILSLVFVHYQYTGGAHPNALQESCTYNLNTDELLEANDIIGGTHDEAIAKIKRLFIAEINNSPDEYYGNAIDIVNEVNDIKFYINGMNELVFYFNQYEIAPYAGGVKYITMPIPE